MAGKAARTVPPARDSYAIVEATGINNGLVHSPVTPFDDSGDIDFDLFGKVLDFHAAHQPGAVAIPMDAGERFSLRDEERKTLVEYAVDRIGKTTPVIADVTHVGSGIAASFAAHAQKVGAKGVLLTTPYFQRPPANMMLEHFRQIAAATDLAVLLHSSPRTHKGEVRITQDMVATLMEDCPNIAGYIDGEMYWVTFTWLRRYTLQEDPNFLMFPDAEYLTTSMPIGGNGSISPVSAIAPKLTGELYRACREKDYFGARENQYRVSQLSQLMRNGASLPANIKAAMAVLGRPVGRPRQPNLPLPQAAVNDLRAELTSMNIIGHEPEGWDL